MNIKSIFGRIGDVIGGLAGVLGGLVSVGVLSQIVFGSGWLGIDVIGNIIKVQMAKSRFTQENKKVEVKLSYKTGLDRYYGLLDLAEKYDIIKKVSTRYELPDGSKVFGKNINEDPTKYFTDEIMAKLEVAAKKEFEYGGEESRENDEANEVSLH